MLVAKSYIGRDYVPGEVLPEDLPEETVKRLIEAGAVEDTDEAPEAMSEETVCKADEAEEKEPESTETEAEEPVYEDEPAEEIDVMDGIVKPKAKKAAKRKGGK